MKITTEKKVPEFQPVTLTVTLESQEEVNTLYRLHGGLSVHGSDPHQNGAVSKIVHTSSERMDATMLRGINGEFYYALQGFTK